MNKDDLLKILNTTKQIREKAPKDYHEQIDEKIKIIEQLLKED